MDGGDTTLRPGLSLQVCTNDWASDDEEDWAHRLPSALAVHLDREWRNRVRFGLAQRVPWSEAVEPVLCGQQEQALTRTLGSMAAERGVGLVHVSRPRWSLVREDDGTEPGTGRVERVWSPGKRADDRDGWVARCLVYGIAVPWGVGQLTR